MNKSHSLLDDVAVDFADNLFIHLINRRGPSNGVRMTYQMYLKYKAAGHKVSLAVENTEEEDTIESEDDVLHVEGDIPPPIEDTIESEDEVLHVEDEEIAPPVENTIEEEADPELKKYSKTQFRKWDRDTLENYLDSVPSNLIPESCLPFSDKDKSALLEIIFQYVLAN